MSRGRAAVLARRPFRARTVRQNAATRLQHVLPQLRILHAFLAAILICLAIESGSQQNETASAATQAPSEKITSPANAPPASTRPTSRSSESSEDTSALAWDLAYTANVDGKSGIWLLSHGRRRLLTGQFARAYGSAWSPDGEQIAFTADLKAGSEIRVLSVATGQTRQLTANKGRNEFPAWSPDGRSIAFTSHRQDNNHDATNIYLIDVDGTHERRLTSMMDRTEHATWSPDGKRLAFQAARTQKGTPSLPM
jgi:Tol biopolymer transport system component